MASIFDKISNKSGGVFKSANWYRNAVSSLSDTITARKLYNQGRINQRPSLGRLNLFFYDPKFKKTLPYYDTFPLVLPIETYSNGFLGINLHYLSVPMRIRLLDRLTDFANNKQFDETTTIQANYRALKNVDLIKPCLKRYLAGYVKSKFRKVEADEFMIATLLPVQRFKKQSDTYVFGKSRGMV